MRDQIRVSVTNSSNGKASSIFVDPQDTVSQMKAKLQKLTDFGAVGNNMRLVLNFQRTRTSRQRCRLSLQTGRE